MILRRVEKIVAEAPRPWSRGAFLFSDFALPCRRRALDSLPFALVDDLQTTIDDENQGLAFSAPSQLRRP